MSSSSSYCSSDRDVEENSPIFHSRNNYKRKNQESNPDLPSIMNGIIIIMLILIGCRAGFLVTNRLSNLSFLCEYIKRGSVNSIAISKLEAKMDSLKQDVKSLENDVEVLEKDLKTVEDDKQKKVNEKTEVEKKIAEIEKQKDKPAQRLKALNDEIKKLESKSAEMKKNLARKKDNLKDQKQDQINIMQQKKDLIEGKAVLEPEGESKDSAGEEDES